MCSVAFSSKNKSQELTVDINVSFQTAFVALPNFIPLFQQVHNSEKTELYALKNAMHRTLPEKAVLRL